MKTRSSLRKRLRKLITDSKGFSAVIGTVFMVLVMMFLSTSVFLWTLSQNTLYNQAVKGIRQMEADSSSEAIATSHASYTIPQTGTVEVGVTISNEGPVSAQIVTAWVVWIAEGTKRYGFNDTLNNINLSPGDTVPVTIRVSIPGVNSTGTFSGWLTTARGNMVPLEEKKVEEITVANVAAGIGSVSMNFTDFKYYNVTNIGSKQNPIYVLDKYKDGGGEGYFVIQGGEGIAFEVSLTNFDRNESELILFSASVFWTLFPDPENPLQARGAMWYIVNVNDDGIIAEDFTPVPLPYCVETKVFFASKKDVVREGFDPKLSRYAGITPVNLALFGEMDGSAYGQNVPFVSIYVSNARA